MTPDSERVAGLAFLPIVATFVFYFLPLNWQSNLTIQFIPQIGAFLVLSLWACFNTNHLAKLGLEIHKIHQGVQWGIGTGILLGCFNASVILYLVPSWGGDITFLRDTPHAQLPFWVMMPWVILCIACAVELNFRGFLLGRLLAFFLQPTETRIPFY